MCDSPKRRPPQIRESGQVHLDGGADPQPARRDLSHRTQGYLV
jgi:hypothetical protein